MNTVQTSVQLGRGEQKRGSGRGEQKRGSGRGIFNKQW